MPTNRAVRDQLVLEHLSLVKAIAVRVHENLPVHVDMDDLIHAGIMGLFDAATKYNPGKEVVFHSYAKHRIKGAILDSLRQLDWASRDLRKRFKQMEALTRDLTASLDRTPTEVELAAAMGVSLDRWRRMMVELRSAGMLSNAPDSDFAGAPDYPAKPAFQPDSFCSRGELRSALQGAVKTLPERYQRVVFLYYSGERTMKEIGGILGINESRVSQIHKSALEKMQVALHGAGIHSSAAF